MKTCFDPKNYSFNEKSRDGVYIIHGFTNTTYEIKELAVYLSKQGFYTRADNLPGHGTTIEDCNRCKYTDWIEAVEQGIAEMVSRCDNIYVIGISMGSVLALQACSIFPLNAAVFASTVLIFKDFISVNYLAPMLHRVVPYRSKRKTYSKKIRDDMSFFGYDSWPTSAVNEMRKMANKTKKILPNIKCPSLVIHSRKDLLSPQSNIALVYDNISSDYKEKFVVENAPHNLFAINPNQEIIFQKISGFLNQFKAE